MAFLTQGGTDPVDTNGCAVGVHITDTMTHDQNLVTLFDQLTQCVGFDTGLHSGVALHLLGFTAKVSNIILFLYNRLIATTAQSHIHGSTGKVIILGIGICSQTQTDTDGNGLIVADADGLYILQQSKLFFF